MAADGAGAGVAFDPVPKVFVAVGAVPEAAPLLAVFAVALVAGGGDGCGGGGDHIGCGE